MKSLAGVPLYYVVCDDLPATHDFQGDDDEERLHRVRQNGNEWNIDNKHTVWSSRPMATSG
jgi:hypothetical protein